MLDGLGWTLAYFQWESGLPFSETTQRVPLSIIRDMYAPYHEMDVHQFCDVMRDLMREAQPDMNLKTIRMHVGLSQSALSTLSGVPLRSIQQYEQRRKDINRAQAETVFALAKALRCPMENILERI